ncbi:MAG: hypothetical protein KGH76_02755 [Thaumarchaeota archaeon]|jgi:hypothetical protein|uniref:PDGLE domain-containing protein n=1 Tax=Nitrosotalea sinensis TaxID=1499975 RepID=A0A2H1EFR0_9ARCH|nr:hypothetical protein [Candidatus Nitrosotalea sinensis]MDE1724803.1 hypothetical protein [Nitrososphaerota archaeon]SHO44621.1 conserved exported hypothetical protein [Candidatus Nitrosotalea sinensis]
MKTPIIIGTVLLALFVVSTFAPFAAAQYAGVGGGGGVTLEDQLKLARAKIQAVQNNPHAGSGTPYLDANGVIGASIIAGGVFGGIFIAFVVRAKQAEKAKRA